jgi:peroxiredoxin
MVRNSLDSGCAFKDQTAAVAHIAEQLEFDLYAKDDSSALVLLLDQNNRIQWRDDDYRAQGEHLKPLERKLKTLLGQADEIASFKQAPPLLTVGDMAPDFAINESSLLSDHADRVKLITFYPAAFSGTLDTSTCMMCCSLQLTQLATSEGLTEFGRYNAISTNVAPDAETPDALRIGITSSNNGMLEQWQQTLRATALTMVNDPDYAIAQRYNSFDAEAGYNRRTVFIIDRKGVIRYINTNYSSADLPEINRALREAQSDPAET